MGWRSGWLAAAAVLAAGGAFGQAAGDACGLMGRDEFQALTGKTQYGEPTGMPWGEATVCGFNGGQIMLWTGADSRGAFDRYVKSFGVEDLPSEPVEGLGEGAFAIFYDPEDAYQDHGAGVVFGAGPPTVAVMVNAEDGEPPEAVLPQAMAVAQAVAGKLE